MTECALDEKLALEVTRLKQVLKARQICLELIRPISKPAKWIVSDTDISCFAKSADGELIFEFNFSSSLNQALTDFVRENSISAGVRFWLTPENKLQFEKISKESIDLERKKFFELQEKKYQEAFEEWKKTVSSDPFGIELAKQVYEKLALRPLCYSHKEYCGTGFFRTHDTVTYCEFEDGHPSGDKLAYFESEKAFVDWLSLQSDRSLARLDEERFKQGNQTIYKVRLFDFVNGVFR